MAHSVKAKLEHVMMALSHDHIFTHRVIPIWVHVAPLIMIIWKIDHRTISVHEVHHLSSHGPI
jgi:hypothetical protein